MTGKPPGAPMRTWRHDAAVQLQGVSKRFLMGGAEVMALSEVTLTVPRGQFVVLLGPSGSGKTTLLNVIGGLERPTAGRIVVAAQEVTALNERALTRYRRHNVGFVFQFFNLVPSLTARENVLLAAQLVPRPRDADDLLAAVGLGERAAHFPGQLSGGEQQRVAIARALIKNPELILADEPTGSLDSTTGGRVLELLHDLARREGRTVLLVTHDTPLTRMADRVIRLKDGRVEADQLERAGEARDA